MDRGLGGGGGDGVETIKNGGSPVPSRGLMPPAVFRRAANHSETFSGLSLEDVLVAYCLN